MLSYIQSLAVVVVSIVLVLCVTSLINYKLDDHVRKQANGVNGWQLSILGSIYAVVLGFMLSDAWLAYQTAVGDVRGEAAAALTIYRTSSLLPAQCALPLQAAAEEYVDKVSTVEWPAMEQHRADFRAGPIVRSMWNTVNQCDGLGAESARESVIRALEMLQTRRDARVEDFSGHLPLIMWNVLLFGAVSVIASSCLLGNEKQSIHYFHVISLTILISVTLLAISDLDRPFDGATRIDSTAFRAVQVDISKQPAK